MGIEIKFDKQALERVANEALRNRAAQIQQVFDGVHRAYAGQPIAEVRPALEAAAVGCLVAGNQPGEPHRA